MRKSSLGRRSSIPVRVPSIGGNSAQRICSDGKKSLIRPPGYSRRSRSEDRESCGSKLMTGPRSSSAGRSLAVQTPYTPLSAHSNMPQSTTRPVRSLTMSTDKNRRASSIGGKNSRKDSRPINEKGFQQEALAKATEQKKDTDLEIFSNTPPFSTQNEEALFLPGRERRCAAENFQNCTFCVPWPLYFKVQEYFDSHPTDFLNPGQSIRPMNLKLFVDMVDYLIKQFDPRQTFTKSNYIEELPPYLKKMNYRSKVDKSWLVTVNTMHSWPHVIALLSWLVDSIEIMNAVDPMDLWYPPNIDDQEEEEDNDDEGFPITRECLLHLKRTFKYKDDPNRDAVLDSLHEEYVQKEISDQGILDEHLEVLQTEIERLRDQVEQETQRKNELMQTVEDIKQQNHELINNCHSMEEFIEQSKAYIVSTQSKLITADDRIKHKQSILAKEQIELKKLQEKLGAQQFTLEDKERMVDEKRDLHRMIQYHENEIREYDKSAFPVDLELAKDQKKLQDLILDYNKQIAVKLVEEPRLRDLEMEFTLIAHKKNVDPKKIDQKLQELKEEFKGAIHTADQKIDAAKKLLKSLTEQVKVVEENICQETKLLDAVELECKEKKKSDDKELKKLREEISHAQALSKQLDDEISKLDTTTADELEIELQKILSDKVEVKRRCSFLHANVLNRIEEGDKKFRETMEKVNALVNKAFESVENT